MLADDADRPVQDAGLAGPTSLENELANLQRDLAASNAELAAMNQWKIRFLAMVAHDLRGPLTAIRGFAELLDMTLKGDIDEGQQDMLAQIMGSSDRLGRMIDELMDASALEAGKFVMNFEQDIAVTDLVKTATTMHEASAQYKGIEIVEKIASGCPGLRRADPNKFVQVLANLVSNAVKYSHRGTKVTVSVFPDGDQLVFEITDEGQGMGQDDIAAIFTPYGTTSGKATAGETSTGLGLTIVQAIVHGHGGTIEVRSTVDVGSTFRIAVPIAGPLQAEPSGDE